MHSRAVMKRSSVLVFFVTLELILLQIEGNLTVKPLVVGGVPASQNEFPYQLSLRKNGRFMCGASLISQKHVLTAAHCAVEALPGEFSLGGGNVSLNGQEVRKVTNVTVHPGYNRLSTVHDIAIMELSEPFNSVNVKPVELYKALGEVGVGVSATVTGWGKTGENEQYGSDVLMKVGVPIVSRAECIRSYGPYIQETMICAGLPQGGKDSCQGDSGGPLVVFENGKYIQIGVVSFGEGCARKGKPGVYTQVSKYRSWISSVAI